MGMEDFGVILRPNQAVSVSSVECQLVSNGFVVNNPAFALFSNESIYVLSDKDKNIEALVKRNADDHALMKYLSIRYAVCQPQTATQAFLDVVSQLVCKLPLEIEGISSEKTYSRGTLSQFREFALERIVKAKSRWSNFFEQDTEEVVLSVADTWKYFRTKHPGVFTK
jgi:hypothetical protein